ncbi:MAG: hypothetical protein OEU95_08325 [Nitrospirota bacterium]|nr:hypothetical protein [Nitrospirota bacterium]
MEIDARELDMQDLLKKLKENLSFKCGCDVSIDIMLNTTEETRKVSAFAAMSGCKTKTDKKGEYYIMHITGTPCCS